jgi:hypothetical protein
MEFLFVALFVCFVLSVYANFRQSERIAALESFGDHQDEYIDKLISEITVLKRSARAADANIRDTLTEAAFAKAFPELDALGR